MSAIRRFWRWLTYQELPGVPYETVVALREESFQIGVAVGELRGRQALARELELLFPPNHAATAEDAANVKARQLH